MKYSPPTVVAGMNGCAWAVNVDDTGNLGNDADLITLRPEVGAAGP
jgi:hypothetical protein